MDRNLLLAVGLSIGVYAVWFGFIDKKVNPPRPAATAAASAANSSESGAAAAPEAATEAETRPAEEVLAGLEELPFGDASIRVDPRGAALASFLYPEPLGRVELVHDAARGLFATWPELEFRREKTGKSGYSFSATRADGLRIFKEYIPGQGTLLPRLRVVLSNPTRKPLESGAWTLSAGPGLGTIESEKKEKTTRLVGLTPASAGLKGRVEELKVGEHAGPYRWVGVDNRYFLAAMLPSPEHFSAARAEEGHRLVLAAKPVTLPAGGSFAWEVPFYLGAKGHTWLSRFDAGLERSIDFGFFAQLGRFILGVLERLHRETGNWGWSIVILTLGLQVLLFPLTWKSLRAAAAMKKLQPEIARLQQRYADDATKMNSEMMALYKKTGANPLGGCLPMLLQMPIFVALFNALRGAWELHGAEWMFWIKDLSAKDPYYVLPLVMGALMFLQSKMNPPSSDPTQKQMMMMMPIVFTFMFLNFPSGLVLYWLTNSLVSTVLQVALKDRLEA